LVILLLRLHASDGCQPYLPPHSTHPPSKNTIARSACCCQRRSQARQSGLQWSVLESDVQKNTLANTPPSQRTKTV
jgi:hypothetical protein